MDGLSSGQLNLPTAYAVAEAIQLISYDPTKFKGNEFCPENAEATDELRWDEVDEPIGMTHPSALDADPRSVIPPDVREKIFTPGYFKEYYPLKEKDIIRLRMLGTVNQIAGAKVLIQQGLRVLKFRLLNRKEWMKWKAAIEGRVKVTEVINGEERVRFNIDLGMNPKHLNMGCSVVWSSPTTATPIDDLFEVQDNFVGSGFGIGKVYLNTVTAREFCATDEIRKYLNGAGIKEKLLPGNIPQYGPLIIPGSSWSVTDQGYRDANKQFQRHMPDHAILFIGDAPPGDIMELLATAHIYTPDGQIGTGDFAFIIDETGQKKKTPKVEIVSGWYGGPRMKRADGIRVLYTNKTR